MALTVMAAVDASTMRTRWLVILGMPTLPSVMAFGVVSKAAPKAVRFAGAVLSPWAAPPPPVGEQRSQVAPFQHIRNAPTPGTLGAVIPLLRAAAVGSSVSTVAATPPAAPPPPPPASVE